MSPELARLIEKARGYRMTPEEELEQMISFAYGNTHYEDPRVTREGIERAAGFVRVDGKLVRLNKATTGGGEG